MLRVHTDMLAFLLRCCQRLKYIFFRPFRLSLAPFICPWVSEDVPDSNKLRFKYLSHVSLHEGPPNVYQDPGLPLIEARDSCFSSKIWAKFRIESIRGRWDCTKFWVGITGLKNPIRDPLSRHMPREMIACNKAFPFFGEEQRVTGKILGAGQYLSLGGRILGGIT